VQKATQRVCSAAALTVARHLPPWPVGIARRGTAQEDEARRAHEAPSQDHSAVQRWKRALGRFIETYGQTANEEGATEQGELHLLVIQTTW
jgi:hypothetical protein